MARAPAFGAGIHLKQFPLGALEGDRSQFLPELRGSPARNPRLARRSFAALEHLGQRPSCSSLTTEPLFVIRAEPSIAPFIVNPYRTNCKTIHIPEGISNCAAVSSVIFIQVFVTSARRSIPRQKPT